MAKGEETSSFMEERKADHPLCQGLTIIRSEEGLGETVIPAQLLQHRPADKVLTMHLS